MKKIIVALFAIAVIRPAFAKDTWYPTFGPDGNHLTVACKAALRVMDANDGRASGSKQDAYDDGYCQGIVSGVASHINSEDGADLVGPNPSVGQLIRVVQKYMDDHPEELSKPAVWLIRTSLIKAFPKRP